MEIIAPSPREIAAHIDRPVPAIAKGAKRGLEVGAVRIKALFRRAYASAGLGRLSRAWSTRVYPERGGALAPAIWLSGKGGARTDGALEAFGSGAVIRANRGRFLAVPSKLAGKYVSVGGKRERITPALFERRTGIKLQFVPKRGRRPALLVAEDVRVSAGRGRVSSPKGGSRTKNGRYKAGIQTAVIFFLVPAVRIDRRVDLRRLAIAGQQIATHYADQGIRDQLNREVGL